MSRVVVGEFQDLFRMGLEDILTAHRIEFVARSSGMSAYLKNSLPDVVVLNADVASTRPIVEQIVTDFPVIKVITCSTSHKTMQVYPAFRRGESYSYPLEPGELGRQVGP